MSHAQRYAIAAPAQQICQVIGIDPARVARRAGLAPDFMGEGARLVTASEFYALWDAMDAEARRPELPDVLADAILRSGFDSAVYSFFCSPTVRIGLERKALFKPLLAPIDMEVKSTSDGVAISFSSIEPTRLLPSLFGWFDLVYFVRAIRQATGEHVVPLRIEAPLSRADWSSMDDLFGCTYSSGARFRMLLSAEDANLPLISRNDGLWAELEQGLRARFANELPPQSTAARVRQALVDGLPGGQVTADQVSRALAMSKRSLQRRLSEEGSNFKHLLEDTRRAMAMNYLQNSELSVQEIAFLLGFRDPSSFFRAFRAWTGQTPLSMRQQRP